MKSLIVNELIRFRGWALIGMVAHILVLVLLDSVVGILSNNMLTLLCMGFGYSVGGISFGIFQLNNYRKISQWTYLIHRPLALNKVFLSIIMSALILIVFVVGIPLFMLTLGKDIIGNNFVETRHYTIVPVALLVAFNFYLVTMFAMLHPKRIAFFALIVPFVFLYQFKEGYWVLLNLIACSIVFGYLSFKSFKPDLESNIKEPVGNILSNIVLQSGIYTVIAYLGFALTQFAMYGLNIHPFVNAKDNSFYQVSRDFDVSKQMRWLMEGIDSEDYEYYSRQLELSEHSHLWNSRRDFPHTQVENQPHFNDEGVGFQDAENNIRWMFVHSEMLYRGVSSRTNEEIAWLGLNGTKQLNEVNESERFQTVPSEKFGWIYNKKNIYKYDEQTKSLKLRYSLPDSEQLMGIIEPASNFAILMSDKTMYFFDKKSALRELDVLTPYAKLKLPRKVEAIQLMRSSELVDGHLISMFTGEHYYRASYTDTLGYVYKIGFDGSIELLNQREFTYSTSYYHIFNDYWFSAPFAIIETWIETDLEFTLVLTNIPPEMLVVMLIIMLTTMAICMLLMRNTNQSILEKLGWILGSGIIGIPGLITCYFLSDWELKKKIANSHLE